MAKKHREEAKKTCLPCCWHQSELDPNQQLCCKCSQERWPKPEPKKPEFPRERLQSPTDEIWPNDGLFGG